MKIIVPCEGKSKRFPEMRPKWMLNHPDGDLMVTKAIKGLNAKPEDIIITILKEHEGVQLAATVVNFHGDFSSEKVVIGQYLDGRVTAVIGDHWHVPTADTQVQPKGTAHVTDVGMVGSLDASLGVETKIIVARWKDPDTRLRNEMEGDGRRQFNALLFETDTASGLAKSAKHIRMVLPPA